MKKVGTIGLVLLVVAVLLGVLWWRGGLPSSWLQKAGISAQKSAYERLPGQWLRADGGYILEIHSVAPGGTMEAAYYNPQPIHVAKAEASKEGETVKLFIELRDVNYPGSTYTLTYDAAQDSLAGAYFQAAIQQTFDVAFTRVQP